MNKIGCHDLKVASFKPLSLQTIENQFFIKLPLALKSRALDSIHKQSGFLFYFESNETRETIATYAVIAPKLEAH